MPQYYRDLVPYLMTFISGSVAACGTTSTQVAVPSKANMAVIHAEGGDIFWNLNGTVVADSAPGYCPSGGEGLVPAIDNLGSLYVCGTIAAAKAHCEFYQA